MTAELSQEQDGFWEPWTPEIGQRVRINTRGGECRKRPTLRSPGDLAGIVGHADWEHGLTGTVESWRRPFRMIEPGHRFLVRWDRERIMGGLSIGWSSYAAIELIPLDSEP